MKPPKSQLRGVLANYFEAVRRTPRLSREDEEALSRRIQDGQIDAINDLVTPNLAFVAKIARRYKGFGVPYEDLLHEGSLGLIEAAKRFDGSRHTRFIGYAVWWIRKYISEAVARQSNVVHLPQPRAGRTIQQLGDGSRRGFKEVSLDTLTTREGKLTLSEVLPDPAAGSAEDRLIHQQSDDRVDDAVHDLPTKERLVLQRRYGLEGAPVSTLTEIGDDLGVTRERVRQIEVQAKCRLRRILMRKTQPQVRLRAT